MRDLAVKLCNDEVIAVKIPDPSTVMDCLETHNLEWCHFVFWNLRNNLGIIFIDSLNSNSCDGMNIDVFCRALIEQVKKAKQYFQIQQINWANIALFVERFSYIKKNEAPQRICYKHAGITQDQMIEPTRFYEELNDQINCELAWDSDFEDGSGDDL
eukprot:9100_1